MNTTKLTVKSAAKLGFLLGLASPVMLFSPGEIDFPKLKTEDDLLKIDEQNKELSHGYEAESDCGI